MPPGKQALRVLLVDSLDPNRAASRHRPAGLSVGTRLTGAVAAPAAFGVSPRLPSNKLEKYRDTEQPTSFSLIDRSGCLRAERRARAAGQGVGGRHAPRRGAPEARAVSRKRSAQAVGRRGEPMRPPGGG